MAVIITGPVQAELSTRCAVTVVPSDESVAVTRPVLLELTVKGFTPPEIVNVMSVAAPKEAVAGLMAIWGNFEVSE